MDSKEILLTPTLREAHSVLRRKKFLCLETHTFLLRKLNDLRGTDMKDEDIIERFTTFAIKKYNISPFNAVLYYFYNKFGGMVNINETKWDKMHRWLVNSEFIDSASDYSFGNIQSGIAWIVAFRMTSIYFRQKIKGLSYEESWVSDK